jgi:hypothetical protein
MPVRAIAVFSGQTDFWWQRLLKPGFRHCGVLVEVGGQWIVLEPLAACLEIRVLPPANPGSLIRMLRRRHLLAIETAVAPDGCLLLIPGPFTCVEAVKRVLGIRAFWVNTPWQLYKNLISRKKNLDVMR